LPNNQSLKENSDEKRNHRVEPLSTYLERSLILKITVSRLGDAGSSLGPHLDNELCSHLGYINDQPEGRNDLLGDELTAADIQLSFGGSRPYERVSPHAQTSGHG
jgi:hypothetical protein